MARKQISKKTITFYEGDEELLEMILAAAKADKRNFSSFAIKALIEKVGASDSDKEEKEAPSESKDALNGW